MYAVSDVCFITVSCYQIGQRVHVDQYGTSLLPIHIIFGHSVFIRIEVTSSHLRLPIVPVVPL
jgi:hypothetical protein